MRRSRIRWSNVGRVAAGLAVVVALIALVPGLLAPDEPESLPPDVGLATGAGNAYAYVDPEPRGERAAGAAGERGRAARPGVDDQHHQGPAQRRRRPAPAPEPEPVAPPSEPPSTSAPAATVAPAPASPSTPAASPTPPAVPEPPDQPDEPPPPPDRDPPVEGDPPAEEPSPGPTQFGFEQRPQGSE